MILLITGGAGFIGSNFVRYMLERYPTYRIVNLDVLTYAGNPDNLKDVRAEPRHEGVRGDIADRALVEALFAEYGFDAVVHFAAESHVDRSIDQPDLFIQANVVGTQTLLDAARKFGVRKFIQISTDEVYGSLGPDGLFTESTPLSPNSPYSASKAGADLLARAYHETYGVPVAITRCSNNYGPCQFPEKLIPLMISRAMDNSPLPIYGDGLNIRDWLHVEDHCSAVDLVLHHGRPGGVYNVGGRNERSNLQVVKTILNELGKPESLIQYIQDRPGHDRRYGIDADHIGRELGWRPIYSFDTGIRATLRWYMDNRMWWERILSGEYRKPEAASSIFKPHSGETTNP